MTARKLLLSALVRAAGWADRAADKPGRVFLALALALSAYGWILGPFSYLSWEDLGDSHISRYLAMKQGLVQHGIAYWYAYAGGGADILANGTRYFDLLFASFLLLPAWLALSLLRTAQLFLAGYFMQRLLEEQAGVKPGAAFMGGLAFLLLQINLIEHYLGFGAIPLLVWGLARLETRGWGLALIGAALIGGAYSLVGFMHLTGLFFLPCAAAWLWVVAKKRSLKLAAMFLLLGLAYAALQADMLAAMALNAPTSHRVHWDLTAAPWSSAPFTVLEKAHFTLFILLAALPGLLLTRRAGLLVPLILFACAVLAVAWFQYELRIRLPDALGAIKGLNLLRLLQFLPFLWAAMLAWSWQKGLTEPEGGPRPLAALVLLPFLAMLGPVAQSQMRAYESWIKEGSFTANFKNPQMARLALESRTSPVPFRVATIEGPGLKPSYANAYGLESADSYLNLYGYGYKLLWQSVIDPILRRDPERAAYIRNYGPNLYLTTYARRTEAKQAANYFNLDLLSLLGVRYFISKERIEGPGLELVEETRPDIFWTELAPAEKLRRRVLENFQGQHLLLYRNARALPRWFFVRRIESVATEDEMVARMSAMTADELATTALVGQGDAATLPAQPDAGGSITPRAYAPDLIRLDVRTDADAFLVVANSWNPFWRARIDGKPSAILRTDLGLWGLAVPAGAQRIEFAYEPPYRLTSVFVPRLP